METQYTGKLEIGDLALIASGSYIDVGFYIEQGKSGTFQYYTLNTLTYWYDAYIERKNKGDVTVPANPWKSYVMSPAKWRLAKISKDMLDGEYKEKYNKSIEALKLLKLRK